MPIGKSKPKHTRHPRATTDLHILETSSVVIANNPNQPTNQPTATSHWATKQIKIKQPSRDTASKQQGSNPSCAGK
jgi:hypothetical protein